MKSNYKKTCKLRILDNVTCVFLGLSLDHLKYLHEKFSEFTPNYFFNPKYKFSNWDGKIHYVSLKGKSYINLIEEVLPDVIRLGYDVALEDTRKVHYDVPPPIDKDFFSHIVELDYNKPWEMRPYQVDLVNVLLESGFGVGIAGTGAGKTACCAALASSYEKTNGFKSIIIVPDKNLTNQTHREYGFFGLDVGQYYGESKDIDHTHLVSTWQSLKNNPLILAPFDVVIVDECHGIKGPILSKLLNDSGKHIFIRYGVTGTLPKEPSDAMAVQIAVGPVKFTIPAHELINQGYLAKMHIDVIRHNIDFRDDYKTYLEETREIPPASYLVFKNQYFPDWISEKQFLQTQPERLAWIAAYIDDKRNNAKGNVLCLVDGLRFGRKLTKMIPDAIFLEGKDEMDDRKKVFELFKTNNNLAVLASIKIASTGLDIKRIYNLMFIDVGKSFVRVIQSIGRGLRKAPDKDFVQVSDICSDLKYSKRHLSQRKKFYIEAKYKNTIKKVDYNNNVDI